MPTDRYLAVEDANGLIAAIADAHSLEAAGDKILLPLTDGRLGTPAKPWSGLMVLDGNLTEEQMRTLIQGHMFSIANFSYRLDAEGRVLRHSMTLRTTDRGAASLTLNA